MFYLLEHTFDRIAITMDFVAKVNAEFGLPSQKPRRSIDDELGVIDLMFLSEFLEKQLRGNGHLGGIDSNMEDHVGLRVDGGEEPLGLAIDFNDGFVEGDLLRFLAAARLEVGLLDPVVNGRSAPIDTKFL